MTDSPCRTSSCQTRFSWTLVVLGLTLLAILRPPTLPDLYARLSQGLPVPVVKDLGLLLAISAAPVYGLWRLSPSLGLPRWLPPLFPCFPIAVVGVYLVKPFLDRIRPPR